MTESQKQDLLRNAVEAFAVQPSGELLLDLQRIGLINSDGEVLERDFSDSKAWNAYLAIVETNATDTSPATHFRCRKPAFGKPGLAEIDIQRAHMVECINKGKRVITAVVDDTGVLREGEDVHCVDDEFLRTDQNKTKSDNLGNLPTFVGVRNRM